MSADDSYFDEAVRYRQLARTLRDYIGASIPCTCVNTEEYDRHLERTQRLTENMSRDERLFFAIFNDEFPTDKMIEKECDRCKALWEYESAIGDDAVDLETMGRLRRRDEQGDF